MPKLDIEKSKEALHKAAGTVTEKVSEAAGAVSEKVSEKLEGMCLYRGCRSPRDHCRSFRQRPLQHNLGTSAAGGGHRTGTCHQGSLFLALCGNLHRRSPLFGLLWQTALGPHLPGRIRRIQVECDGLSVISTNSSFLLDNSPSTLRIKVSKCTT